jgi:hypothetical protein
VGVLCFAPSMLTANSPTYRCAAPFDVEPGRPNYLLGRHDSDLSWGYRGLNGNSLWMAVAASAAWPSNTQLMQIADDIGRCVKASHACSLMVVNDEITSLRA